MPDLRPAIIGAGPIGLEVAWALRQEGLDPLHFDAGQIGSTINWWAPGTRFFSSPERIAICGVPLVTPTQDKATREEYLAYLRGVGAQFDLRVQTFERVTSIQSESPSASSAPSALKDPDFERGGHRGTQSGFRIRTESGVGPREYEASHVIVAIGDMHRPRRLDIPGEDLPHVSHYFKDPHQYFGRRVLIVGGKNSAVEAAIRLYRVGAQVTISYRLAEFDELRIKYWLLPEIKGLIKSGHIRFEPATMPLAVTPAGATLTRLDSTGKPAGPQFEVPTDEILLLTGYEMDGSLLAAAGVGLSGPQLSPTFSPRTMETNVPGLYVAGTATAGTQQRFRVFIENCHNHGPLIAAHILGHAVPEPAPETPVQALES
jgi:thioredoxin reductase (NADPH)